MTNPQGSEQTVRIWDKNGSVGASLQVGKFPPNDVTGIVKDGGVLVLTTTVRENGAPIWAVAALTVQPERAPSRAGAASSQVASRSAA